MKKFTILRSFRLRIFIIILLVIEWLQRNKQHGFEGIDKLHILHNKYLRPILYALLLLLVIVYGGKHASFIYFQF